jgi:hypothetical protein
VTGTVCRLHLDISVPDEIKLSTTACSTLYRFDGVYERQ